MDVLINMIVIITSKGICILSHHIVHLENNHTVQPKYIWFSLVNHTSIKLEQMSTSIKETFKHGTKTRAHGYDFWPWMLFTKWFPAASVKSWKANWMMKSILSTLHIGQRKSHLGIRDLLGNPKYQRPLEGSGFRFMSPSPGPSPRYMYVPKLANHCVKLKVLGSCSNVNSLA